MRKVLITTYYWPPCSGSGVQRWMYFSKYLSDFNYDPFVITVSEKSASYKNIDAKFNDHVKDVKTYKTATFELLKLYSFLSTGNSKTGIPNGQIGKNKKKKPLDKISAFIRGNFFIPDARIGWNKHALKKARQVIKEENIDLIITTGPPHSTHLIGLKLKKEFPVKWVADFRDPWSEIYYNHIFKRLPWAVKKDRSLELKVLKNADKVLTVGMKLKELLAAKISGENDKFHHIYNGYDAILMQNLEVEKHDHFELIADDGVILRFNDPRRFGCVLDSDNYLEHKLLKNLGPEPLTDEFDGKYLKLKSINKTQAIKNFIMDNHMVVGVGNIYASEALFMAGISPLKPAGKVSLMKYKLLATTIKKVLSLAIQAGGTTLKDFINSDGKPGYFSQQLQVYGRKNKPCLTCNQPIKQITVGQRSTFYCSKCQK